MIVIYCSGFCPALFFIMYRLYCFAVQILGGTTEREVKPLFFVYTQISGAPGLGSK